MTGRHPTMSGWVGYGDGQEILLRVDQPLNEDHPLVVERPELFRQPEPGPSDAAAVQQLARAIASGEVTVQVPERTAEPGEALPPVPEAAHPDGADPLDPPAASEVGDRYDDMTLVALRGELGARQLPTSGNKPDLAARLRAADAAAAADA